MVRLSTSGDVDMVAWARERAEELHRGQRHGDRRYVHHLADVVGVLDDFGFKSETYRIAGWLHDSLEDTDMTLDRLRGEFGDLVAQLVYAVTDEPGRNRRERVAATLPKTASYPPAIPLKVADRIANVRSCWDNRDSRLFMYQREYKEFRKALRRATVAEHNLQRMWDELDSLLGWWEPGKS